MSERNDDLLHKANRGNVYLAGRYATHPEMQTRRDDLNQLGYYVTSRWINGGHEWVGVPDEEMPVELGRRFAQEDLLDMNAADIVICFTEEPRTKMGWGGRHVEFGWAVARGKAVAVVGPRENVFYCLGGIAHFDTWQECLDWLMVKYV